jgi:hypothetical protein
MNNSQLNDFQILILVGPIVDFFCVLHSFEAVVENNIFHIRMTASSEQQTIRSNKRKELNR